MVSSEYYNYVVSQGNFENSLLIISIKHSQLWKEKIQQGVIPPFILVIVADLICGSDSRCWVERILSILIKNVIAMSVYLS